MARGRGRGKPRGRVRKSKEDAEPEYRADDVFEAEDSDPDEVKHAGQRYDVRFCAEFHYFKLYIHSLYHPCCI